MELESYLLIAVLVLLAAVIVLLITSRPKKDRAAAIEQKLDVYSKSTDDQLVRLTGKMQGLTEKNYEQQIKLMETLSQGADRQTAQIGRAIAAMQESNEKKLEQMRLTVDEKLTETLDRRINSSFRTVSEQLQNVYRSLGEMKELSSGVTENVKGLNRVLANVKSRGTWAEVQLGSLLDQTIPGMYETNVRTNPKYNGQVEFAIRIPQAEDDTFIWLPVDSKFPMEDYVRLTAAADRGDAEGVEEAKKALEATVRNEAKLVRQYISVPETTPFAILYLATEGLYSEIAGSRSGIAESLHGQGVMIAGPSTVTALLNSLSMGFRTVAINRKANEVYKVLSAAKAQYDKFGDLLARARKKVDEAGQVLDEAGHRNEIIQKNLKNVQTIEAGQSEEILGIEE